MTNPQVLHDTWLILTVITTLEVSGIALYLWKMFRGSSRRWFFWALALGYASIAVEQTVSELKNLYQPPPESVELASLWVAGRIQEAIVLGGILGYLVFGRNGHSTQAQSTTEISNESRSNN